MKKTAEEILSGKNQTWYDDDGDAVVFYDTAIQAMHDFAAQEVAEKDLKIRDFLFNMHEVENDKIVFKLSDLLQFFPPLVTSPKPKVINKGRCSVCLYQNEQEMCNACIGGNLFKPTPPQP